MRRAEEHFLAPRCRFLLPSSSGAPLIRSGRACELLVRESRGAEFHESTTGVALSMIV
jgi:hypothetical protein